MYSQRTFEIVPTSTKKNPTEKHFYFIFRFISNMADVSHGDEEVFHKIEQLMREDQTRVRLGFDKAAAFINGLFCDLSSIDIRFEFDPVSLDDCRCERVALNEFNLMCTLKHLPYEEMCLEGDARIGAIKVKLAESYSDR